MAETGTSLERAYAAAREAWPQLEVTAERFARAVGTSEPETLCASDLYLACALADGHPRAAALFEPLLTKTSPVLASMRLDATAQDEVRQRLRERLLVGKAIARFSGRGSLARFLKAAATREAIGWLREQAARHKGPTAEGDEELEALADRAVDPERRAVQKEHGALFKTAFAAAVATLDARERTLLRQQLLDGLTIDELAPLHRVHRATAARWLAAIREKILRATELELAERAGIRGESLHSLVAVVRSRLDLSLSRILRVEK